MLSGENQKNPVKIGLLGCGTVGSGVVLLLRENGEHIAQRLGRNITIAKVLDKDFEKVKQLGVDPNIITSDFQQILNDPEIEIIVEVMGGIEPARSFILEALRNGKNVVTANKDLIAQSGRELFATAQQFQRDLYFEASVGGGIPVIAALKQSLAANKIESVSGIVNGTTNYILSKMSRDGEDYQFALSEAQRLGYAEADPSSDVGGHDAARKISILASIAFGARVTYSDVFVEGIEKISALDISYGNELGYVLKLLAIAKLDNDEIDVRVHPAFIPSHHPLAAVGEVFNGILIQGNFVGDIMLYGRGAGQRPTASAIVSDVMEVARNIQYGDTGRISCTCYADLKIKAFSDTHSKYYIRLLAQDKPGVLAGIAGAFGRNLVSLASVIQKRNYQEKAEIVLVTHTVREGNIQTALQELIGMDIVAEISNVIRVEGEDGR